MGNFSSILAWKIPWKEESSQLQSMGPQRVKHSGATEHKDALYGWSMRKRTTIYHICLFLYQFSLSVMSDSLQPHELQHTRPPSPSPTPGVH